MPHLVDDRRGVSYSRGKAGKAIRILVVDDDLDAAESFAQWLRLTGNDVQTANDGVTALETAKGSHPQVVFLDISLPAMDGYGVARHIRAHEELKAVLLVAVTGYGREEDRRRCMEAGFDHHVTKPINPEFVRALLASVQ